MPRETTDTEGFLGGVPRGGCGCSERWSASPAGARPDAGLPKNLKPTRARRGRRSSQLLAPAHPDPLRAKLRPGAALVSGWGAPFPRGPCSARGLLYPRSRRRHSRGGTAEGLPPRGTRRTRGGRGRAGVSGALAQ